MIGTYQKSFDIKFGVNSGAKIGCVLGYSADTMESSLVVMDLLEQRQGKGHC